MKKNLRLLGIFIILSFLTLTGVSQSVFINEIHYDNVSTDEGEAIEIAGPAGTNLTGWSLVLYNGSNGTVYNTIGLSETIPNQSNGFGTVAVTLATNGLQNGSPDGIALVDASSSVIQLLSYEGSFSAVDGPASGKTSIDIAVAENSSTLIGNSLQLSGTGTTYPDFTWQTEGASTFGAVNTGQVFDSPVISLVINEFVFNHTGSDTNEFVEILSTPNTDVSEYTLLEIEGDATSPGIIDEVITLGTTNIDGYWTTGFLSNAFENGTVSLLLVKNFTGAAGDDLDTNDDGILDVIPWDEILDDIAVNDGGAGDLTYAGVTLFSYFDGQAFTPGGASRIPNGFDTETSGDWVRNNFDGAGLPDFPAAVAANGEAINTPGAANEVAVIVETTVVINEIDADTPGTDEMEFVELFDGGIGSVSLDGYVLVFYNGSNDLSYNAFDLDGFTTDINGYFVLGNAGVPNVSIIFSSNGLQNGADAVALYKADATDFPTNTPITAENLIDAVVYDTDETDDAGLLTLLNAGQPQVNENGKANKDFHSLQRYPNGEGGLRNTNTYTAAIPTPGASNTNATEEVNIVINEVDADTDGSDVAEFIELYDGGAGNTSLNGFVVVLYNGSNDLSYNSFDLTGQSTGADGYFVLGNSGVTNVDFVFNANGLQNGPDAVALYQGAAADFPYGTAVTTTNLIDALVYDTNDTDDAGLLILLNAGEAQIDESGLGNSTGHSSQRIPNGSGGARNTSTYTQAAPTPGTENGAIVEPEEPITILEARNTADGTTVTISGILTVSDQFAGSAYIQDITGAIGVFDAQVHGDGLFQIGDSITLTGKRSIYNNQIQISPVSIVVSHGPAVHPIEPIEITLAQLYLHPAELVRIAQVSFPTPGDLLFGNTNFVVTDASGSGEMRLDVDVNELVGLAQPEVCELIGVVGRFNDIFQLMPRLKSDLPCAEKFSSEDGLNISKELTLDVVAWNIEWFGDEGNSPAGADADIIQKDSVKSVIQRLDADIIGVEEISDDVLFAQMVSELSGYSFILSEATSYPNEVGVKQKVGFIYKTATVSPVSTKVLLAAAHPYYNGGDASLLADFPDDDKTRFFASGRLPFMLTADVTINGITERVSFIDLHARANSSDGPQSRYDMRKYDVEALKDTLDLYYANENIIMVGDYNDDVDVTVADIASTESSFQAYVNDAANYSIVSSVLSDANFRSYVFYPNMIDHIMLTNELSSRYIDGSARVHYEFYNSDYTYTTSDHFPVSARLQLKSLELVSIYATGIDCNGGSNGSATVEVIGGIEPFTYLWNDGQTAATAINLGAGTYTVTVTDKLGAEISGSVSLIEPDPLEIVLSRNKLVYPAYLDSACTTISIIDVWGGSGEYSYLWSTGETTESIEVCPIEETEYTITVTDENGCDISGVVIVTPVDILCSNNTKGQEKLEICFHGKTLCVAINAVDELLKNGAVLGACSEVEQVTLSLLDKVLTYPNPFVSKITVTFTSDIKTDATIDIYTDGSSKVLSEEVKIHKGFNNINMNLASLTTGTYVLVITGAEIQMVSQIIIKQ